MTDAVAQVIASVRSSQMLRLLAVGFLALILLVPVVMIGGLVSERQERRDAAVAEVSSSWGLEQSLTGPALVVPWTHRWTETRPGDPPVTRSETRHAIFLPEELHIRGSLDTEERRRGIFAIPVYAGALTLEGEFARPDFSVLGLEPAAIAWDRARLVIGVSDPRAIRQDMAVTWDGRTIPFEPGTGAFEEAGPGIQAQVGFATGTDRVRFSFPLHLQGSEGFHVTPFGRVTTVELRSNHAHPSFQGTWLPVERTVSAGTFEAKWSVPYLGRNFPQAWPVESRMQDAIQTSRLGVGLANPVDHYRMAQRSVKYAGLFILLTFAAVWLIEVLAGVRVHPIQYLLLGGALCLFYLLELSLSEHLGFPLAYSLATLAVVGMVAGYSAAILHHARRAGVVAAGVALLYAYLYVLLRNEDYALLLGSVGLFLILGAIMYATRRVDWYAIGERAPPPSGP
jgi:inner membrane protein